MLSAPLFATAKSDLPSRLKSPTATDWGPEPALTGDPVASTNPPPALANRIVTFADSAFATAKSGLPSRLKSATATDSGPDPPPSGEPGASTKLPLPTPNRIVSLVSLPTARSGLVSPLKSPAAKDAREGPAEQGEPVACLKPPVPLPRRIVTVALSRTVLAAAKSGL